MTDLHTFTPRRVLVCQQRQIGDVLLTTPAIELVRTRWPEAEIHVLTERKCAPMLENNPHVGHLWLLDKAAMPTLAHEVRWYWQIAGGYDVVLNFQPTLPRLRWVVGFAGLQGARVRLTTTPPWYLRPLYTHTVTPTSGYACEVKAGVLAPFGIVWQGERPRLYLRPDELEAARRLLAELGMPASTDWGNLRLVSVDPTHRQPTRRWPLESFARCMALLAAQAQARGLELRFLPLWGPGEAKDVQHLLKLAAQHGVADRLVVPPHMLNLRESAACMTAAALHLGNCSSPRHMAVAVNTSTCIVRGSTGPEWAYPAAWCNRIGQNGQIGQAGTMGHVDVTADLPCQPCDCNTCNRPGPDGLPPCLTGLPPERVADAALPLIFPAP